MSKLIVPKNDRLVLVQFVPGGQHPDAAVLLDGQEFHNADFNALWIPLMIEYARNTTRIIDALAMDGQRRTEVLNEMSGKVLRTYKALLDLNLQWGWADEDYCRIMKKVTYDFEEAITAALQGDLTDLSALAQRQPELDTVIAQAAQLPTRGHRQTETRTRILRDLTGQAHRKGQSWLITAQRVIAGLDTLSSYDWAAQDAATLRAYLDPPDPDGCKGFLRQYLSDHNRGKAVRRAGKV